MAGKQQNTLRLAQIDEQMQSTVKDTLAWQAEMRAVVVNSISAEDVQAIIGKQVERAKAGNESAAKFVLQQVLGTNNPVTIRQTNIVTDVETAARIAKQA